MNNLKTMIKTAFLLTIFITGFTQIAYTQSEVEPPREYTNPEEMISFDRRTPFPDAMEVLTNYSQQYENRFIIDRTNTTGPIGVSLPAMHWKDALNYIMRVQKLVVLESEDVLEIVTEAEAATLAASEESVQSSGISGEELDGIAINTDTREVRINATFFEGNKRALQEIGVDWSTITSNVPENLSDFVGDEASEGLPSTEFDGRFVSVNTKGAQNVSQSVFSSIVNLGDVGGGIEVQALFSAFEADNLGQILATPSVKVMDGQEGRIQVGQDFSIKQRDFAGNVTDQFFSTGTILLVRPQIVQVEDTTLIYLELEAERSSAQPDPVSTVINKQQANTHALLLDGESTVIAGLYRTEESEVRRGIPILKDLPGWFFGLKYLFGYNSIDRQESELIVLLQAELEEPLNERLNRSFKSKSELLSQKQQRHRNDMEYISDNSPVSSESSNEDSNGSMSDASDGSVEEEQNRRILEIVEAPDVNLDDIRPGTRYASLEQHTPLQRSDLSGYQGTYKEMELHNVNSDHGDKEFYAIGGSFKVRSNADRLYEGFIDEGLDAHMLYNPVTGFYFVAYKGFEAKDESIEYVKQIQASRQPEAWLSRLIKQERRLELNGE
jgi:type IV pilus assembly protein PilQ